MASVSDDSAAAAGLPVPLKPRCRGDPGACAPLARSGACRRGTGAGTQARRFPGRTRPFHSARRPSRARVHSRAGSLSPTPTVTPSSPCCVLVTSDGIRALSESDRRTSESPPGGLPVTFRPSAHQMIFLQPIPVPGGGCAAPGPGRLTPSWRQPTRSRGPSPLPRRSEMSPASQIRSKGGVKQGTRPPWAPILAMCQCIRSVTFCP